jgi:hypothetical protein
MRRTVSFVIAISILVGGLCLAYIELFEAQVVRFGVVMAAGFMIALGGGWFWDEVTDPVKSSKSKTDA